MKHTFFFVFIIILISCNSSKVTYQSDLNLIKGQTTIVELTANKGRSRLFITPEYQGKIMTSSFNGLPGESNGWINREALAENNIAGIGGEDRVWITPLGSQFSFYYQQINPLNEDNWKVPSALSDEKYELLNSSTSKVEMTKEFTLTNFKNTRFNIRVNRTIKILSATEINKNLQLEFPENLKFVAFESSHELINVGDKPWEKNTGLAGIWSAGMYKGTNDMVVIIPLAKNSSKDIIYKYLGELRGDRLQVLKNVLLFKADGKYRSKIGVPNNIAPEIYGCYSKGKKRLTIIQYKKTVSNSFSNSTVSIQKEPYKGEVIPIYNNGTMDYSKTDKTSFYELETTSPFVELKPNEKLKHFHRVYHFSGSEKDLNNISEKLLGISLKDCILK
ncbi:DUF6786 family protein [Lutibacter citreus]|uniref:DUF6786 family protein n=1 Tax=Lutibacter citreus TaxID=2138210 RepID=UPI000DBEA4A5|nr:DUF6786 family protein [Lutibacter citreus]